MSIPKVESTTATFCSRVVAFGQAARRRRRGVALVIVSQPLPKWVKPQLARLADEAPSGKDWLHEVKYDDYRIHARIESGRIKLLTRTGLDWSHRYRTTVGALATLP